MADSNLIIRTVPTESSKRVTPRVTLPPIEENRFRALLLSGVVVITTCGGWKNRNSRVEV